MPICVIFGGRKIPHRVNTLKIKRNNTKESKIKLRCVTKPKKA